MSVKPDGSVKAEPVERAIKTEIEWLVDRRDGAPNFEMRRFRIRPGGKIPRHFHPELEHEQYVLRGSYKMGIGREVYEVRAGDSVFIPKGTVHWYQNTGDEDAEFLCIIPKTERYESVYPDEEGQQS
ncbi:MAG: cupin domain-containing protein [Nitrososphaerota archaeon]|jgi:quercetin dioxygenase-like cupin family protein|nr:cupin domain-containing protein [Nitrososphaerota archaeon]MDG6942952.1 cupin domain-containing protein [Nitrososphaerota archaeon]MDG6950680.1 cupin domain-containing protein [Nitrososphaerota archaeon]